MGQDTELNMDFEEEEIASDKSEMDLGLTDRTVPINGLRAGSEKRAP